MKLQTTVRSASLLLLFLSISAPSLVFGQRRFTAKDDVGLALFEYAGRGAPGGVIKYSPDAKYFAAVTERGRLDLNAPEDTVWLFRVEDLERSAAPAKPLALARVANDKDGPLIENVRWLADSSAIAFTTVKKSSCCKFHQLFLADVRTRAVKVLTPDDQDVGEFDIRSARSYVYEVKPPVLLAPKEETRPAVTLTGQRFWSIAFPKIEQHVSPFEAAGLWAVIEGERRRVVDAKSYETTLNRGVPSLSLSPDGRFVVAIFHAEHAPKDVWARYKAPTGYEKFHLPLDTSAYHLIDLATGSKKLLIDAPCGLNQDWHSYLLQAAWSADGQSLLLSNTFLPLDVSDPKEIADRESRAYITVLRMKTGQLSRVLALKAGLDKQRFAIKDARFEDDRTIVVNFDRSFFLTNQPPAAIFHEEVTGHWQQASGTEDPRLAKLAIRVENRESINQPPHLAVEDKASKTEHEAWDPNPQLKDVQLGSAEIIHWKDSTSYEWEAGLVLPPGHVPGSRYPLVIQTHGFSKKQFLSNGIFTTAFAAQAMAAHGIAILQMGWNANNFDGPREAPDQVLGFQSAVKKLTDEGLVDPGRVGVIGFSRTVYHVLGAITSDEHLFAAASVSDGINLGYFEYISAVDGGWDREADAINGGKPFDAEGMKNWQARSPEFSMNKVQTPLLLLQPGPAAVVADWEPYAALRYLKKPVDLIMLQPGSHVMTNPTQRLASETTNVDWFRFWLKDEEDPDPGKAEQYQHWRELRKLQQRNEAQETGSAPIH